MRSAKWYKFFLIFGRKRTIAPNNTHLIFGFIIKQHERKLRHHPIGAASAFYCSSTMFIKIPAGVKSMVP